MRGGCEEGTNRLLSNPGKTSALYSRNFTYIDPMSHELNASTYFKGKKQKQVEVKTNNLRSHSKL